MTSGTAASGTAGGVEWVVEAFGCDAARLADVETLSALVDDLVATLALRPVAPAQWHQFPSLGTAESGIPIPDPRSPALPGGITALVLLAESHLALHSFPEHASLCVNLFCCVPRAEWDWRAGLARHVAAADVRVRRLERPYAGAHAGAHAGASAGASAGAPAPNGVLVGA